MIYVTAIEKKKHFLMKPWVKTIIITVLTTAISILVGMLGNWDSRQSAFWLKVIGLGTIVILYIITLIWYATVEVNRRRTLEVLEQQVDAFSDLATLWPNCTSRMI